MISFIFSLFLSLKLSLFIFLLLLLSLLLLFLFSLLLLLFLFHLHFSLINLFFAQEIFTCLHLDILQSWLLFWWERIVFFLLFLYFLLFVYFNLLELWKEPVPVLIFHVLVFKKLSLYHKLFYVINWVNVLHCVNNHSFENFDIFKTTNHTYRTALN